MKSRPTRGRNQLLGITVAALTISACVLLLLVRRGLEERVPAAAIRTVLTALLFWLVWSGHHWARRLLGALFLIGAALGAFNLLEIARSSGDLTLPAALVCVYAASGVLLLTSTALSEYVDRRGGPAV